MASECLDKLRENYRRITEVDVGMIARELLGAHVLHEPDHLLFDNSLNYEGLWVDGDLSV